MATRRGMVVVGAGQAGGRAALALRDQGYDGRIVLLGAEPSPPYERPPLSKSYLTGERAAADFTFAKAAALEAAGIEFHPGCMALAIDRAGRSVRLADGEEVAYGKLLLATGREPRRLPLDDAVAGRVLYLRDLADADRLRDALRPGARIAIVGGGLIGPRGCCERGRAGLPADRDRAGAAAVEPHGAGRDPDLSARAPHHRRGRDPARGEVPGDRAGGRRLCARAGRRQRHRGRCGADRHRRDATHRARRGRRPCGRRWHRRRRHPRDCRSGHLCRRRRLRLSTPDGARAAAARMLEDADVQGALAARNMLGAGEVCADVPWFWSDQYELTFQMAGAPERGERTVERDVGAEALLLFHLDRDGRLVGVSGVGPPALGRDLRIGQLMIERGQAPDAAALADPAEGAAALRQSNEMTGEALEPIIRDGGRQVRGSGRLVREQPR